MKRPAFLAILLSPLIACATPKRKKPPKSKGSFGRFESRKELVEFIVHDMAWRYAHMIVSKNYTNQQIIDMFREYISLKLAEMVDIEIPKTIKERREFLNTNWEKWSKRFQYADNEIVTINGSL